MAPTFIRAALLADGISTTSRPNGAVLIEAGRIQAVGTAADLEKTLGPDTARIDLGEVCLGPGLIDGHTHLSLAGDGRPYADMFSESDEMMVLTGAMNLDRHLRAGITTAREHGARNRVGFALKEGLGRGYIGGPRLLVSGRPITCTGGHFNMCNEVADGDQQIRRSVRRLVHEGADYIKIMASGGGTAGTLPGRASYSAAELHAAAHEAQRFHRLTAAHCRASESMKLAVEAGINLMEHAEFLDPDEQMRFDPQIAAMLSEAGTWISPTLQAWTNYPRIAALESLTDPTEAQLKELDKWRQRAESRLDIMRRLLEYDGIKSRTVPGTDSGVGAIAFGHLDYDLRLLVQVGFSPAEAFASATRVSAEAIGMGAELGTLEPGKIADMAAFLGDPNRDVLALSQVEAVFQAGVQVL
jgi:imidazolonepropionase-like amidohydrolase